MKKKLPKELGDHSGIAFISNDILWDVKILLNEPRSEQMNIPPNPSPWEIAYILMRFSAYIEALVYFEKVAYIISYSALEYSNSLHHHLNPFSELKDCPNPLIPLPEADLPELIPVDSHFRELQHLMIDNLLRRKGFRQLFRQSEAYKNFNNEPYGSHDFASRFVSEYWASRHLNFDYYANIFESMFIFYDISKKNLEKTHQERAKNKALRYSKNVIEGVHNLETQGMMESSYAFDITFPPTFLLALMESYNFKDLFRVVFDLRDELKTFRMTMRELDSIHANRKKIKDALKSIEEEKSKLDKRLNILKYISLGPGLFLISIGVPIRDLFPPEKKSFVKRFRYIDFAPDHIAGKITDIFKNEGYSVDGKKVIQCINTFLS